MVSLSLFRHCRLALVLALTLAMRVAVTAEADTNANANANAITEDTSSTPAPSTASTTTDSSKETRTTTSEDETSGAAAELMLQDLRRRAPQPWGTKWLDKCRLLSPFTWWGVANLSNIELRPILNGFIGIVLPALVYHLAKCGGGLLHVGMGTAVSHINGNSNGIWSLYGIRSLSSVLADDFSFSSPNLIIPHLLSPWTLGMLWSASSPVRKTWTTGRKFQSQRSTTPVAAWQSLVEGVESGRVYRTRRYDVYLPPSAPAGTTYTPTSTTTTRTTTTTATNAILFLPGGGVEHVAYSVPATMLSNAGYTVVVVSAEPLLLGIPALGTNVSAMRRIQRRIEQRHDHSMFPSKTAASKQSSKISTTSRHPKMTWALLGHSLGAFTVCQLAKELFKSNMGGDTTEANSKVVMWAVIPIIEMLPDLSGHQRLPVLVVQGSRDYAIETFATEELTKQFWQRLPEDAAEVVVAGGTHSGFTNNVSPWTKKEKGGISNEEQQRQAVRATVDFLQKD